ncbi:undecaprenyldiphospho-muramoylpentapeptide beta-N-acetylglucosaminyltransferase [[Eubacterium] hominis]|uniref:undecaprenyldiphospho-muramoylpentapeptide beta-N-acetylglucosaminyltransferase n=1 Tax=[Eubacterium] hominis TaxID=2764325 RepID=UPI003A4DAA2E
MRMLIATGGTGGHIYPALALADAARNRYKDVEILFVGNDDRMESVEVPAHGYAFRALHASGLTGNPIQKAKAITLMIKAYRKALHIIDEFHPDIAIGFGGYVSAPVMLAAHKRKVKTMIHEQNSIVGVSNKLVAKKMDGIVICYEKCFEEFGIKRTRLLGNPRATSAVHVKFDETYYKSLGLSLSKPTILVVMGSLGSTSVNEMMKDALPEIDSKYQVLFVTGKNNYKEMKAAVHQKHIVVVDYVKQLDIMEHVDLIVCRAGATTAAEITALGTPSILIPSPYVAHNHQFYNASVLVEKHAAFMIEEKDLNAKTLVSKIDMIMKNDELRKKMRENALALGKPNASEDILNWCEEMVKVKR